MHIAAPGELRGARSFGPSCFALLGVLFLARVAFFFLPCEWWGFSAYSCAVPLLALPQSAPRTFVAQAAYGEGARIANRLDYLTFRSEKFTVDKRGYRNSPTADFSHPKVVLSGSSFSLGLSLNDEETLSAQIDRQLGPLVYNASITLNLSLSAYRFEQLAASAGMSRGWILLELINRAPYSYRPPTGLERYQDLLQSEYPRLTTPWRSLARRFPSPFALITLSSLLNMRIHNDVLLPNPYKDLYPEEELITGRRMLFFSMDRDFSRQFVSADGTAAAAAHLRDDLKPAGLKLAVILVPTGYSVYYPLLRQSPGPDFGGQYMTDLAAQLARKGVPAFNCLPLLREAAATGLAAGRLVYWPDDAHWNPAGVAVAARGAAPWLRALTSGQSSPGQ